MNNPNQNQDQLNHDQLDHDQHSHDQLDSHVEEALRNFRLSMHHWSEHELSRRPSTQTQPVHSVWHWLMAPAVTWAAAAAIAITAVGVPLGIHHHKVVVAQEQAAVVRQHMPQQTPEPAPTQVANSVDDDKLLEYVDADIAQQTPDAMQPLASLMKDSGTE